MSHAKRLRRRNERGQTIILVAFSMLVLLGLAALAIDVVTLYVSRNEAQRAADAAALAGAKAFVTSGYTSGWLAGGTVCSGNTGLAAKQAQAAVAQNPVAGAAPTITTSCSFEPPNNPRITVTVQRTGLPLFFARIWRRTSPGVSATAVAEAFNPSGIPAGNALPISVASVKPWAVPNCDPNHATPANPNCGGAAAYFVNPPNYSVANPSSSPPNAIVGSVFDLCEIQNPVPPHQWTYASPTSGTCPYASPDTARILDFLATDVPISAAAASCPSSSAVSCTGGGLSLNPGAPGYPESIACANATPISCGQTLNIDPNSGTATPAGHITSQQAALCMIHASNTGPGNGQDLFCGDPNLPSCTAGSPVEIDGGGNNPSPALNGTNNISRSDSIVTVPIWDPGPNGAASSPVTIVGFLQLGIVRVRVAGPLRAVVLNVVGCGSAAYPPTAPVFGGGVSPIPVRLINPGR